jgi:hypothetical protein
MGSVRIRFPNESFYETVTTFNINDFTVTTDTPDEIFGIWNDVHVAVNKQDYENLRMLPIYNQLTDIPLEKLQRIAVKHDISVYKLEQIINELVCG